MNAPDYLNPDIPANTTRVSIPIVDATAESLRGYGGLVESPDNFPIEIVRWPAKGWRPVDADSGNEAGTTEGIFTCEWRGDILFGRNEAVGGHYILGYGVEPRDGEKTITRCPGGCSSGTPIIIRMEVSSFSPSTSGRSSCRSRCPPTKSNPSTSSAFDFPETRDFISTRMSGTKGSLLEPELSVFSTSKGRFMRRVSVDFPREFVCLLEVDLVAAGER